jgi:hypothetical protein
MTQYGHESTAADDWVAWSDDRIADVVAAFLASNGRGDDLHVAAADLVARVDRAAADDWTMTYREIVLPGLVKRQFAGLSTGPSDLLQAVVDAVVVAVDAALAAALADGDDARLDGLCRRWLPSTLAAAIVAEIRRSGTVVDVVSMDARTETDAATDDGKGATCCWNGPWTLLLALADAAAVADDRLDDVPGGFLFDRRVTIDCPREARYLAAYGDVEHLLHRAVVDALVTPDCRSHGQRDACRRRLQGERDLVRFDEAAARVDVDCIATWLDVLPDVVRAIFAWGGGGGGGIAVSDGRAYFGMLRHRSAKAADLGLRVAVLVSRMVDAVMCPTTPTALWDASPLVRTALERAAAMPRDAFLYGCLADVWIDGAQLQDLVASYGEPCDTSPPPSSPLLPLGPTPEPPLATEAVACDLVRRRPSLATAAVLERAPPTSPRALQLLRLGLAAWTVVAADGRLAVVDGSDLRRAAMPPAWHASPLDDLWRDRRQLAVLAERCDGAAPATSYADCRHQVQYVQRLRRHRRDCQDVHRDAQQHLVDLAAADVGDPFRRNTVHNLTLLRALTAS